MALLTIDDFYQITIRQTNAAGWTGLGTVPEIPQVVADAIVNATPITVYVIDDSTGQFAFPGGQAFGYDDAIVASASAAFTKLVVTDTGSATVTWGIDAGGSVFSYDPAEGFVRSYDPGEVSALKAFLP